MESAVQIVKLRDASVGFLWEIIQLGDRRDIRRPWFCSSEEDDLVWISAGRELREVKRKDASRVDFNGVLNQNIVCRGQIDAEYKVWRIVWIRQVRPWLTIPLRDLSVDDEFTLCLTLEVEAMSRLDLDIEIGPSLDDRRLSRLAARIERRISSTRLQSRRGSPSSGDTYGS